jgi:UDP-N-acetyl-D-glucosamine dehydrogenase
MNPSESPSSSRSSGFESMQVAVQNRTAQVVVMGLGAVGLALVRLLLDAGFSVLGVDPGEGIVGTLRAGRSPMRHFPDSWCVDMAGHKALRLVEALPADGLNSTPHVAVICVPTPLRADGDPDLGAVRAATESLASALSGLALVSLESTTYPGTTREVLLPILEAAGHRRAPEDQRNLWLAFAPERVNPGGEDPAARHAPRLGGGFDGASGDLAAAFYSALGFETRRTQTPEVAEAAKLVENVYRAVNIALVNELKVSLAAQGIDIWQVLDAAETKPFGFQRFNPGPGAGGSCIPIDPRYLEFSARRAGSPVRLVELAGQIDASMAEHVVEVCVQALASKHKTLHGSGVLLLGVAYKADVDIITESPALRIAGTLAQLGAQVAYHDPHVPGPLAGMGLVNPESVHWSPALFEQFDLFVLVTDHAALPYSEIEQGAPLIVDTRGHATLRKAGSRYFPA